MRVQTLNGGPDDEPNWGQWAGGGESSQGPATTWTDANGNTTDGTWGQPPGDSNPDHFVPQGSTAPGKNNVNVKSDGSSFGDWCAKLWPYVKSIVKDWSFKGHSAGFKRWKDAGAGVHDWFTTNGRQSFLDFMDANHPDKFGSVDEVLQYVPAWALTATGGDAFLVMPGGFGYYQPELAAHWYKSPITEDAYKELGIDYPATKARILASGRNNLTAQPPILLATGAVAAAADVVGGDAVDAVNNGTATGTQSDWVADMLDEGLAYVAENGSTVWDPHGTIRENSTGTGGGGGVGPGPKPTTADVPWGVLLVGAGLAFAAFKKK